MTSSQLKGHEQTEIPKAIKCLNRICKNEIALKSVKEFAESNVDKLENYEHSKLNPSNNSILSIILDVPDMHQGQVTNEICSQKSTYKIPAEEKSERIKENDKYE